ncbi:MAG: TIGR02391 family protein [Candidatus Nanosynbacter sp. HMT-348_TM7c-JB]|nr:MAG: TIGR02391 family protein [Candidatus Nanosynbacter sp. HMT-348_TM7c-JB]
MTNKITKITRYAILEVLDTYMATDFYGRLNEVEFWERIFNLEKLPSTDSRYPDMKGDLWQHRVNNNDWDDNWYIDKFDLLETEDAKFLKFLAEFFHPKVRDINRNTKRALATINKNLALDGVELYVKSKVSGRDILGARNITPATQIDETPLAIIDNDFISLQINKNVYDHIKQYLINEDYFHAVDEAYKLVRNKLQEITDNEKATEVFNMNAESKKYYTQLFGKSDGTTQAEKDFFRGVGYLNLTIQFLRDEKAHTLATALERNLAIHYISFSSLAYDLITRNQIE